MSAKRWQPLSTKIVAHPGGIGQDLSVIISTGLVLAKDCNTLTYGASSPFDLSFSTRMNTGERKEENK